MPRRRGRDWSGIEVAAVVAARPGGGGAVAADFVAADLGGVVGPLGAHHGDRMAVEVALDVAAGGLVEEAADFGAGLAAGLRVCECVGVRGLQA